MIRNIIFDWSGTLVDDLPAVWRATNHVFSQAGVAEMSLERFRAEFCLPFRRFYDRYTPHVPMRQLEEWFHRSYREAGDGVAELPHARSFLEFCRHNRLRTFLLSTVARDHFEAHCRQNGLAEYLGVLYLGVWDKRNKIHEILRENDLAPRETLFVGDMQHDIETARHGGIYSCAVLTGYNGLEQLRASNPDLIVEHLGELRAILERTGMEVAGAAAGVDLEGGARPVATVGALIFNDRGQVLMVQTQKWSDLWGIPGGKIKYGETAQAALEREILEETGLGIGEVELVLVQDCIRSPEFYREAHFVLLNYTCRTRGATEVKLNDEAKAYRWVSPVEALQLDLNQPTRLLLETVLESRSGNRPASGGPGLRSPSR